MKKIMLLFILLPLYINSQWLEYGNTIFGINFNDLSGYSVAINADGTTLVIGAPFNDETGTSAGLVRVFEFSSNDWSQKGNNITGLNPGNNLGIAVAISDDGNTIISGSPDATDNGFNSGLARIFQYQSNEWVQIGDPILGLGNFELSGSSVSINGDGTIIAIASPHYNQNPDGAAGMVRVFMLQGNNWQQLGDDLIGENAEFFGSSVDLNQSGDILAVGAPFEVVNGISSGSVRIYKYEANNWNLYGNIISSDTGLDRVGSSVSLNNSGLRVAYGATHYSPNGQAKVFEYQEPNWVQLANSIEGEEVVGDRFGKSISLNGEGNVLAVSDHRNNGFSVDTGHAQVYKLINNQWQQIGNDIDGYQNNQRFGYAISINDAGDTLAIGARATDNDGVGGLGSVDVYHNTTILSTEQYYTDFLVSISPNPTNDIVHINFKEDQKNLEVSVYTILGKQIIKKHYSESKNINLSLLNLNQGMYYLKLKNNRKSQNIKILKK